MRARPRRSVGRCVPRCRRAIRRMPRRDAGRNPEQDRLAPVLDDRGADRGEERRPARRRRRQARRVVQQHEQIGAIERGGDIGGWGCFRGRGWSRRANRAGRKTHAMRCRGCGCHGRPAVFPTRRAPACRAARGGSPARDAGSACVSPEAAEGPQPFRENGWPAQTGQSAVPGTTASSTIMSTASGCVSSASSQAIRSAGCPACQFSCGEHE